MDCTERDDDEAIKIIERNALNKQLMGKRRKNLILELRMLCKWYLVQTNLK